MTIKCFYRSVAVFFFDRITSISIPATRINKLINCEVESIPTLPRIRSPRKNSKTNLPMLKRSDSRQPPVHPFFYDVQIKKDSKMQKIQHTGIDLCWNQCHMVRCKIRILECNRKYAICLTAIATACQQTSNPSKSLCKCHRWHHQIKIFPEICLFDIAIQTACQNPADNTSIYNKSI